MLQKKTPFVPLAAPQFALGPQGPLQLARVEPSEQSFFRALQTDQRLLLLGMTQGEPESHHSHYSSSAWTPFRPVSFASGVLTHLPNVIRARFRDALGAGAWELQAEVFKTFKKSATGRWKRLALSRSPASCLGLANTAPHLQVQCFPFRTPSSPSSLAVPVATDQACPVSVVPSEPSRGAPKLKDPGPSFTSGPARRGPTTWGASRGFAPIQYGLRQLVKTTE